MEALAAHDLKELPRSMDELEAGEVAIEFDDEEPQEVLAWAIERWQPRLAICTSFQAEGMALFDMAWRIDPQVRLFTVDTGRLPQETYDVIERFASATGSGRDLHARRAVLERMTTHGPNLFHRAVNPPALLPGAQGAAAPARADELRRLGDRAAPRPVGEPRQHPQDRDRSRPRRRSRRSTRWPTGPPTRSGTTTAPTTCPTPALRPGLHDRLRAVHAPGRRRRGPASRPLVVGDERAQGVRHPLPARDRRLRARAGGAARRPSGIRDEWRGLKRRHRSKSHRARQRGDCARRLNGSARKRPQADPGSESEERARGAS